MSPTANHITNLCADLILDSLPQAVLVCNRDLTICSANHAAQTLCGLSKKQLIGTCLLSVLPLPNPVPELVHDVLNMGSLVSEYEVDVSTPRSGQNRIVDVQASLLEHEQEMVLLVLRERGMADRLEQHMLPRAAARSVTGLAAMLAHEIKNPLAGIKGAAQLLSHNLASEDKELSSLIISETDRIAKIVDRMEIFSDETPMERSEVNVHSIMSYVRRAALSGFASGMEIEESYDPSLPPVAGNRDELVQLFLNLVKNSAEALQNVTDPKIKLKSAYRSGMRLSVPGSAKRSSLPLEFSVSDNGPGITPELRAHVFDPFVTSKRNGSGLGLALVARTVSRHGGMIECDSQSDGTTFRMLLPAWSQRKGQT